LTSSFLYFLPLSSSSGFSAAALLMLAPCRLFI